MRLCSNYIESNLDNNKKFIQISGDYRFTHIHLFVNVGASSDPYNKKGVAHLCEHIFIRTIIEEYRSKITDRNFYGMAFTDYDYTIFKFIVSNINRNVECLLNILQQYINEFNLRLTYIQECKNEVIKEFRDRKEDVSRSIKVNGFLTEDSIDYIPMGNIDDIYKITIDDIKEYYDKYPSNSNLVIFSNNKVRKFACSEFKIKSCRGKNEKSIQDNNSENNSINNSINNRILKINSKDREQLKVYFKYSNKVFSKKENVALYILEIILNYHICSVLNIDNQEFSPVFFRKKIIDSNYAFFIIYIYEYKERQKAIINKFIDDVLNISISNIDLNKAKGIFCELINQIQSMDEEYSYNNIFHYLINNEILAITEEQLEVLRNMVNAIDLKHIQRLKEKILKEDYKVIVSSLDK